MGRLIRWVVDQIAALLNATPIGRILSLDVLRYAICGVTNYIIIDAVLYFIVYHYLIGAETYIAIPFVTISPHIASLIIVFPITFLSGFWLNRQVAFRATNTKVKIQLTRYALSILGSIILSYILLKFLVEGLGIWATPSKVIASLITAIYSYLIARLYTFRKSR